LKKRRRNVLVLCVGAIAVLLVASMFSQVWRNTSDSDKWQLCLLKSPRGAIDIAINQPRLRIKDATLRTSVPWNEGTVATCSVVDQKRQPPFGTIVFSDFTALPGRLKLRVVDHVVDIMPRAIIVDGKEIAWQEIMGKPHELP
jgi:hypothetical protein